MERRLHRVEWVAILVVLAAILTITFWPTPVDRPFAHSLSGILAQLHRAGVPAWVDYSFVQTASNVVMFLPLGALIASVVWRTFWWVSGVLGLALSLSIELTQYLVLPARFATAGDLIANTAGALLGGLVVAAFSHWTRRRRRTSEIPAMDRPL
jgi:glycopeptide antibiotics resistance protein